MLSLRKTVPHLAPFALLSVANAQQIPVFSIDWNSASISLPDSFTGTPITEGDLLAPQPLLPAFGPLPTPGILESAGTLPPAGLRLTQHLPCVGHPAYTQCAVEVDALSHGLDAIVRCTGAVSPGRQWAFSVQYRAVGNPGTPAPPAVWTEAPCFDEGADAFADLGLPCGPLPPSSTISGNTGYLDGDGLVSCSGAVYPGTGLQEFAFAPPMGDNLDALDDDVPDRFLPRTTCTYFSLDSAFIDPMLGVPNSGSAIAHGFRGGDVLMTCPSGTCLPAVYASAALLGLDSAGSDTDDLDALALRENGIPGYQRSFSPYDWLSGQTDMLFFSVRRGSAIVGMPDAFFGLPIEPGDILVPTGGVGSLPGIWIAAENIGLMTQRLAIGLAPDDLDALDTLHLRPTGNSFCFGDGSGTACPCGNNGASRRGCGNAVNPLGALLWENGFPSISNDTVHFAVSGVPGASQTLLFQGTVPFVGIPFGDGLRCVGGNVRRLLIRPALCGNREYGYGVPGDPSISSIGGVVIPGTRYYQVQYRDGNPTFCTPSLFNFTNGYQLNWVP
jgi:hypothetical protein